MINEIETFIVPDETAGGSVDSPFIILPGGDVSITTAAEQIFGLIARSQQLFYRGGRVHEIAAADSGDKKLEPITPAQFRSIIETYGKVFVWRSGATGDKVLKPTLCAEETSRALLESRPARDRLPNIVSMTACSVLANTPDGARVLGKGWHSLNGGLYITGGETPPTVPLDEAVQTLVEILSDFDFTTPGDRSRALASLIAPALRFGGWLVEPLPIDVGEADASQSGKTYRQKVIAAIYRESCNVVVQRAAGVGGIDESISQKLIDGRPFILLDNLRGKLDSPFLEAILTAPGTMPARVPHRGEVQVDTRGMIFQMTSNGCETTRDLANRASIIRIRKRPAGFVFRKYDAGDLHTHVTANQPHFLGCAFAVVNEWVSRGKQRTTESRHDRREWAQTLDWIVQNVFQAAPLLDGFEAARERVSNPRRTWLRSLCIALRDAGKTGTFEHYASQLAEFALENGIMPPNTHEGADEATVARKVGVILGAELGKGDELEVDGFTIHRVRRANATTRNEEKVYRIE